MPTLILNQLPVFNSAPNFLLEAKKRSERID